MASALFPHHDDRRSARIAIVELHVRLENAHDLEGVLHTFGDTARYDDEAWGEHYEGGDGVRQFYPQLMKALPDLEIEIQQTARRRRRGRPRSHDSRHPPRRVAWPSGDWPASRDPALRRVHLRLQRSPGRRENLLRPRNGLAATRRLSRTRNPIRTNLHLRDSSDYDCACFRKAAPAKVI